MDPHFQIIAGIIIQIFFIYLLILLITQPSHSQLTHIPEFTPELQIMIQKAAFICIFVFRLQQSHKNGWVFKSFG